MNLKQKLPQNQALQTTAEAFGAAIAQGDVAWFINLLEGQSIANYDEQNPQTDPAKTLYFKVLFEASLNFSVRILKKYPILEKDKIILATRILKEGGKYSETEMLQELVELVTLENVNELFVGNTQKIHPLSSSRIRQNHYYSLLTMALSLKKLEVANWLLKDRQAKPNVRILLGELPEQYETNLFKLLHNYKRTVSEITESAFLLLKYQANFDEIINDKSTWSFLLTILSDKHLRRLSNWATPQSLQDNLILQEKFPRLHQDLMTSGKINYESFPYIKNLLLVEKRKIVIETGKYSLIDNWEKLFKYESLPEALKERYGLSSPSLIKSFEKVFIRKYQKITFNLWVVWYVDLFAEVFLSMNKNHSDFLEILNRYLEPHNLNKLDSKISNFLFKKRFFKQLAEFLNTFYSDGQKKEVLIDLIENFNAVTLRDLTFMWSNNKEELSPALTAASFSEINTITKAHDFLALKTKLLRVKNFPLEQEKFFPELKQCEVLSLDNHHGIKVAQDLYELINWGMDMQHCIGFGGYANKAAKGQLILVAITFNGLPKYAVEISNGQILQVQGKSGSRPSEEVLASFIREMKSLSLIN